MSWVAQFFQTWGAMISTIALVFTLIFVIKYTIETKKLRVATQEQTALQLSPWIVLNYEEDSLKCRNIGNSPALNVEVSTLRAENPSTNELVFEVTFFPIYFLEVGKERVMEPRIDIRDRELEGIVQVNEENGIMFFPFFPEESGKDEYPLIIDYTSIENVPFKTSARVKCREEKIQTLSIKSMKKER